MSAPDAGGALELTTLIIRPDGTIAPGVTNVESRVWFDGITYIGADLP